MHTQAAEWVQANLSELPIDVRDKFKDREMPGPKVDINTAWDMFMDFCHWSGTPVSEAIRVGMNSGLFVMGGIIVDINTCLKEMLEAANGIQAEMDKEVPNRVVISELSETLAERTIAMDQWLTRGGFKPDRWNHDKD